MMGCASAAASAQDVFDTSTFDQTVQQSTQQEQKAKLETQFGGNLLYDTSGTTTTDFSGYGVDGSFSGKAFVKVSVPDYGALYIAYNFSKNLYQGAGGTIHGEPVGSAGPVLSQAAGDLFGASYALAEFYTSLDISRKVFFRIGNQLLAWGPSVIWTPVDFVNLHKANPLSPVDLRVGKPGIRVTVPLGVSNVFLFTDMSATVTPTGAGGGLVVNDPVRSTNLAARWDLTVSGVELALSGYAGNSIQDRTGFDFSSRIFGFDVYGELAAGLPGGSYSFTWSSSFGFQKTLGELSYWNVAGELFYNGAGTSDTTSYSVLAASGELPFYAGKYYAYGSLTRTHLFIDGLSATLAGFIDMSDVSFLGRLSATVDVPGVAPFTFNLSWSGGGAGKAFTWFTGNNSLTAEIQIRVEF
jgi:hypothetical protein